MDKKISFFGPIGEEHSFEMQDFREGSIPSDGSVICSCGKSHQVFLDKFDHGIVLGEIRDPNEPKATDKLYDASRTFRYFYSFISEKVHEYFPGSTIL